MWLRDLLFKDWQLKLFSLVLAILIWVTVSFAIRKEGGGEPGALLNAPARVLVVPVTVMSAAGNVREFHVRPSQVEVTVRGTAKDLKVLLEKDVHAIVDLTDIESAHGLQKRIEVTTPSGIVHVRVMPEEVDVVFPLPRAGGH
ncbi:MAG: hypothetical protein RLZZ350_1014 [Verrucomicrobiota bacterium]|jgi:YbbR domain-containing protein